jgi:hypothetical protein
VAAVPGILLQQQGWPTLLKDGLFLLPGYLGLVAAIATGRALQWPPSTTLTILLVGLVLIVIVQALRILPTYPLAALIGLKTWLLYIPLLVVPAAVFRSFVDVQRLVRLLVLVSFAPSIVALVEFLLIVSGHPDLAYGWYGNLSNDVTQQSAQVGISDQIFVSRVPSTFTFVTQFVAYCLLTTPICLVTWMSDPDRRWRLLAALASVLVVAAGFASGSRTFFMWGSIEIGLILLLVARRRFQVVVTIVVAGVALAVTLGTQLVQVAAFISNLGWHYLVDTQAGEFITVYHVAGLLGVGAGLGTNASRYVLPSHALPYGIEGWYSLTFLELGLPGLVLIMFLWLALLRHAWTAVRLTRGSAAGPLAIGAFVILLATIPNLVKGVSLEYDPLNVYFWFVGGLAIALPGLSAVSEARSTGVPSPARAPAR